MTLLDVDRLRAGYGHLQVLDEVSLTVEPGTTVALLGTNGAGKSTLLRAVAGLLRPTSGRVVLADRDLGGLRPEQRAALGLTLVEGGRSAFSSLSVDESIRVALLGGPRVPAAEAHQRIDQALAAFPDLVPLLGRRSGALSGGEQQMVALARALVARPRVLLVDELSLGLAPVILQGLVAVVSDLVAAGVAVLLVEQSLNVAMTLAEQAYFLEKGRVAFHGRTEELLNRGDLARAVFFGAHAGVAS